MTSRRISVWTAGAIGGLFAGLPVTAAASAVTWQISQGGNGHSYEIFSPGSPTGWRVAERIAQTKVGYLATITSPQEQAFVEQLLKSSNAPTGGYWLGGAQIDAAGPDGKPDYKWVTGEPFAYTHWDPSGHEPNGHGTQPNVALIWTQKPSDRYFYKRRGGWDDQYENGLTRTDNHDIDQRGYIIERNLPSIGGGGQGDGAGGGSPTPVPLPLGAATGGLTLGGLLTAAGLQAARRSSVARRVTAAR